MVETLRAHWLIVAMVCVPSSAAMGCRGARNDVTRASASAAPVPVPQEPSNSSAVTKTKAHHIMREVERANRFDGFVTCEELDVLERFACERDELRALVARELAWTDERIVDLERGVSSSQGDVRARKARDLAAASTFRERLEAALDTLEEPADEASWEETRRRIERDVEDDRPAAVPRTYETSYAI